MRLVLIIVLALLPALVLGGPAHGAAAPLPPGQWPLRPAPPVAAGFDAPDSPGGAGHRGVDLRGTPGEVVRTAAAGTVTFAGVLAGRGVVTVDHGDVRTTYEPVRAEVRTGDRVRPGQPIGTLMLLQSHCFPAACLHWGLLRGDTYLDPLLLVGRAPVRLLPLVAFGRAAAAAWSGPATTSGPWMGLLVGLAQAFGGDVGVDLGGGQ
jgi:murein DD-endopeptidase MepM/ murein hydrolase activator NlpD